MTENPTGLGAVGTSVEREAWEAPRVIRLDAEAAQGAVGVGGDAGIYS